MKLMDILAYFFLLLSTPVFTQTLDTRKLDDFFNSLEKRQEAMGSITIAKQGEILYEKAIGHRYLSGDTLLPNNVETKYRIWSISKIYTATMILQLVEEGKLSLQTTLDQFYPQIPNSEIITIEHILRHRSGIHDFIQNDTEEDWDAHIEVPLTPEYMVQLIASYSLDFPPNEQFRYSNSNYLLLGYIIERLDDNLYEFSLNKRISKKIGLTETYFSKNGLDHLENKAFSYQFDRKWIELDEGTFSGLIPAGAGGIVSTTKDLSRFIEALFNGQLISQESLSLMLEGDHSYFMGIMKTSFENQTGYGHTGGYIASESILFYYPRDSLSIAYCTNGIVIRKEDILESVLKICHNRPFGISMNRNLQAFLTLGIGLLFFFILKSKFNDLTSTQNLLSLGYIIAAFFWIGIMLSGFLYDDYDYKRDGITILDSFYSRSGTVMAEAQFIVAFLSIPFFLGLYKCCKKMKVSVIPILPIVFFPLSLIGVSLFPFPAKLYTFFVNTIILVTIAPLLATILWQRTELFPIRLQSLFCFLLMIIPLGLLFSRSSIPVFVNDYFGLIQRLLYAGLTLWFVFLGFYFTNQLKSNS